MKKFLIGAFIVVGITIGIVGVGVQVATSRLVDKGLDTVKRQIPDNVAFDYADSDVSLLSRKASLKQVSLTLEDENLDVQVGELTVDELQQTSGQDVPFMINGVQMQDVDITPLDTGETVHIDQIVLRDVADTMVEQITSGERDQFTIPSSLDVDLIGVQITADMLANPQIDLDSFGYQLPIEADISLKYTFSDSDKDFQLDRMQIASDEMFAFDVSTHISGIDMELINILRNETARDPFALFGLAGGLRLYDLNVTYTDDSFMDRALTQIAEGEGSSLQQLKAEMVNTVDQLDMAEADALRDFINDPGELTVGINPAEPLTADDFIEVIIVQRFSGEVDIEGLVEKINLTITSR